MRIAFVGKGGSGKTTSAAVFSRHLAAQCHPVLAIDADINQHLGPALGHDGPAPRALGTDVGWLKDHLRGSNPLIPSAEVMIKISRPAPVHGCSTSTRRVRCSPASRPRRPTACGTSPPASSTRPTSASPVTTPRPAPWSCTSTTSSTAPASTSSST